MALIIDMMVMCIVIMANEPQYFGATLATYPMTIVFSILAVPALIFVAVMWGVHTYLLFNDLTTKEFLTDKWVTISGNPYKKTNWFKNCIKTFCKYPESSVKFKQKLYISHEPDSTSSEGPGMKKQDESR